MPPRLKTRSPGSLPDIKEPLGPELNLAPDLNTAQEPVTPGSKAVGAHEVVIVDEEPDLTIDLNEIVERHRKKPAAVEAKQPQRTPEQRPAAARPPFAGKISLMGRIRV